MTTITTPVDLDLTDAPAACAKTGGCGQAGGLFPDALTICEASPRDFADRYEWEVVDRPVTWRGDFRGAPARVSVPVGFHTDLASVPRFMTWLFPRYGQYTRAAVVHDFLCQRGSDPGPQRCGSCEPGVCALHLVDRSDADELFRSLMRSLGVSALRRWLMWSAVSWATVITAIRAATFRPRPEHEPAGWRRDVRPALVVAIGVVLAIGAGLVVTRTDLAPWLRVPLMVVAPFALLAEAIMVAGSMALHRTRTRVAVYSWAALLTTLSLGLLATGLLVLIVLLVYLIIEDFPRFRGFREFWTHRRHSVPRQKRFAATAAQVTAGQQAPRG